MGCGNYHVSRKLKFTQGCNLDEKSRTGYCSLKNHRPSGTFNDNLYVLINVYDPNKDKDSVKFLEALRTTL